MTEHSVERIPTDFTLQPEILEIYGEAKNLWHQTVHNHLNVEFGPEGSILLGFASGNYGKGEEEFVCFFIRFNYGIIDYYLYPSGIGIRSEYEWSSGQLKPISERFINQDDLTNLCQLVERFESKTGLVK